MIEDAKFDFASLGDLPPNVDSEPDLHAECVRIVQRPHAEGRYALGLLPADDRVAIPALALHLGWALSQLARREVGIVDANVRYPAFPVAATANQGGESRKPATEGNDDLLFVERRIDKWLTLLSPRNVGAAGAGVPQLQLIVERYANSFAHLVVDLTGFQRLGDHLNAVALLDGVIVVARARSSREADLLRLVQELPGQVVLGAILTR